MTSGMILTKCVKYVKMQQRYCQNKTVKFLAMKNTTKIAIKILQGGALIDKTRWLGYL